MFQLYLSITQRSHPPLPGQACLLLAPLLTGPQLWWTLFFLLQIHWRVYRKVPSCLLFQQDKASSMTLIKPHLFPFKEGFTTLSPCICHYSPLSGQCRQSAQELEVAGVLKGRTASPLDIWWKEEIYKTDPLSMPCINVSVGIIFIFFLYALFFYKASSFTSKKD